MNTPDQAPPLPNPHQEWMADFRDAAASSAAQVAIVTQILVEAVGEERFADIASFAVPLLMSSSAEAANGWAAIRVQQQQLDTLAQRGTPDPSWAVPTTRFSVPFQ
jgi:hypothetical protein